MDGISKTQCGDASGKAVGDGPHDAAQQDGQGAALAEQPTRIWNAGFVSVFIANALMWLSQQMTNTLIALYADSLGASASIVGLVVSMFAYTALAFKLVSAPAVDAFNRKHILFWAMLAGAAAYFGYSLSSSIPQIIAARLLQGAGQAFTATCCLAAATDALPRDRMATGIGYFSLAQAACMAIGPQAALALAGMLGYRATFAINGCIMLCAAYASTRIKAHPRPKRKFKVSLGNFFAKEAAIPAVLVALSMLAFSNVSSFLVLYADTIGASEHIGWFFTVYALTMLVSRPLVGKLADRYGLFYVLVPSLALFAVAFILISFSTALWMFLLAAFISAFGYGAAGPALQTMCMKCVSPERRGAGSSSNFVGADLGNIFGPVIAGAVVEAFGYPMMWRIMLIPVFIALAVIIASRKWMEGLDAPRP